MIGRACGDGLFDRVPKMAFSNNDEIERSLLCFGFDFVD